ncbi:MAG: hypothetical protein IPN17_29785 [Deltaproteobacteria bacterium]|nr:hypothetical protein [Deltaproteobacteria bacterium]
MTAHVTIESFRNPETDWRGRPLGRIGAAVTVVVKLWDYANLKGGRFSIKHPAMAPEGEEFEIPKRRATGDRKVLGVVGKHKTTPEDLSHEDTIDCVVHLTQACDGYEPFTLTALENCVTEPAPEATLRCVATQTLFDAARVIVRSGVRDNTEERYDVARAGNKGLPSTIGNTIRACVRLFATLRFKDPDGDERPFPKGTPVKVLLGDHPDHAIDAALGDDGKLSLEVIGHASVLSAKTLTLRLGADSKNRVICELPGDPKSQKRGSEPAETDPTGTRDARFFTLPREWSLREADWVVTDDDGRWVADPAHFKMTVNGRAASLGKVDAPVKLVLDPHWQFLKFEFFDRRYGHSDHADKPKTLPPMAIEGFRYKPTSSSTKPDVRSNWWVVEGDDALQCVPWILQRNPNGTERKRPSGQTLLRFSLPPKTCVHSESATKRTRVIATDEQWKPGPTRLDFYDLPEAWNSRNYYARLSASPHEFGWYEQVASKPSSKAKPLTFSLDDIVLTDEGGKRIAAWTHDDRLAIFAHTFDDTLANTSKEGVYKPDDPGKTPWYSKKPASGAPEENENYVVDHPGWTRLIAAQGNLFDVFDRRTVASSPPDLDYDVIGARAAVCWVDTTKQIGAATMWEPDPSDPDYEQESADHRPSPGRYFKGAGTPAMSDHGSMAVQPYYSQDYMDRFGKYLDAGTTGSIGRFDMALLRCCGVAEVDGKPTELALNLWFHRLCFDATIAPVGMAIDAYQVAFVRNVLDRFNGLGAKNNQKRAELLPKDASKPLKVSVMTFMQVTPEAEAHFRIVLTDSSADARDWRSGHDGTERPPTRRRRTRATPTASSPRTSTGTSGRCPTSTTSAGTRRRTGSRASSPPSPETPSSSTGAPRSSRRTTAADERQPHAPQPLLLAGGGVGAARRSNRDEGQARDEVRGLLAPALRGDPGGEAPLRLLAAQPVRERRRAPRARAAHRQPREGRPLPLRHRRGRVRGEDPPEPRRPSRERSLRRDSHGHGAAEGAGVGRSLRGREGPEEARAGHRARAPAPRRPAATQAQPQLDLQGYARQGHSPGVGLQAMPGALLAAARGLRGDRAGEGRRLGGPGR